MGILVRQGGVWRDSDPSVRQGGVWRPGDKGFVRQGGVWRENYSASIPPAAFTGSCFLTTGASIASFIGNWSAWFAMPYRTLTTVNVATPMQTIRNDGQDGSVQVRLWLEQEWASGSPDDRDSWSTESIFRRPCSSLTDTEAASTWVCDDCFQQNFACQTYTIDAGCNIRGHQIVRQFYRHWGGSGNLNIRFRTRIDMKTIDPYEDWTKI